MGRGITEPNAGSDNRMPPEDDPKAGYRVRAVREGDEWILNGEKCFIANGSVGLALFRGRAHQSGRQHQAGRHALHGAQGHARLPHRQGVQQARLALLPERRADLRERARAARQRRGRGGHRLGQGRQGRHHRRRHLRRPRARGERAGRVRRRLRDGDELRAHAQARRQVPDGAPARPAEDQRDARADRGAALVRDAGRLAARPRRALARTPAS